LGAFQVVLLNFKNSSQAPQQLEIFNASPLETLDPQMIKCRSQKTFYECINIAASMIRLGYLNKFPIQKLAIFRKVKEIKELRGGVQVVLRTSNSAD